MKATLLLVLCIVLFLGYSEGRKHGKFGQQRPRKHRLMRPMRNRPYRLRFGKIKQQMFYHFNRIFGGKRRQSNSTAGQAEFNTSSTAGHPFRILQVCKHRCQDDCASVNSCRQTCRGNCENARVSPICKLNCYVNNCITRNCTACYKACFSGRNECRRQHCSQDCQGRRSFKRPQCKRCMVSHCPSGNSNANEEESDVEEILNRFDFEEYISTKLEDVKEVMGPIFSSFIGNDGDRFDQTVAETEENLADV